jgi:Fic family protein
MKGYYAFLPDKLDSIISKLEYDGATINLLSRADRLIGELSGTGRVLQNPYLLISPYIRREAVSSSKIEGTQSSLSDLFFYEASETDNPKIPDVKEVSNHVKAMEEGMKLLDTLPISTRFICTLHNTLMQGVRGEHGTPGELRRSQNWIGPPGCTLNEATFIPPPVDEMHQALSDWEKFTNADTPVPLLIQSALLHYQFEAIHPFIDGNGRIGRQLIVLFLYQRGCLTQPLLYLSEFFDRYRDEYYLRLLAVSQKGDITGWIMFFLRGVIQQAENALLAAKDILDTYDKYQRVIKKTKKVPDSVYKIMDEIFIVPVLSISVTSKKLGIPYNSVKNGVLRLIKLGILKEIQEKRRNKIFIAPELMNLLLSPGKKDA